MLKNGEFLKIRLTPKGIRIQAIKKLINDEILSNEITIPVAKIEMQFFSIPDPLELQDAQRAQIRSTEELLFKLLRNSDFAVKYGSSPALENIKQI